MTALATAIKRGGLLAPLAPSQGISSDASTVKQRIEQICEHFLEALSLRHVAESAVIELAEAAKEAAVRDWDGYGAHAIDPLAYHQAERFLRALPTTTPVPDVSVDPDGEVAISWNEGSDWVFSVSIGPTGKLSYAGLFGTGKAYGTEWFSNEIPVAVLDNLTRLFTSRAWSVR